jgi:hypothetical protein
MTSRKIAQHGRFGFRSHMHRADRLRSDYNGPFDTLDEVWRQVIEEAVSPT